MRENIKKRLNDQMAQRIQALENQAKNRKTLPTKSKVERWQLIQVKQTFYIYRVHSPLGTGGFASVHKAYKVNHHKNTVFSKKAFALKIFKPNIALPMKILKKEACLLSTYQNLYAFEKIGNQYALITDYLEKDMLAAINNRDIDKLSFKKRITLATQLLLQLHSMHANEINRLPMIHRDIKPDNIMIHHCQYRLNKKKYDRLNASLIDFGLAKIIPPSQENKKSPSDPSISYQKPAGETPDYSSPETQKNKTSFASDIYSLTAVFLFLFGASDPLSDKKRQTTTENKRKVAFNSQGLFESIDVPEHLRFMLPHMELVFISMQSNDAKMRPKTELLLRFFLIIHRLTFIDQMDNLYKERLKDNKKQLRSLLKQYLKNRFNNLKSCLKTTNILLNFLGIEDVDDQKTQENNSAINIIHTSNLIAAVGNYKQSKKIRQIAYHQLLHAQHLETKHQKTLSIIATENLTFEALVIMYSLQKKTPSVLKNNILNYLLFLSKNNAYLKKFDTHKNVLLNKLTQRQPTFQKNTLKENISYLYRQFKHNVKCLFSPSYNELTKKINAHVLRDKPRSKPKNHGEIKTPSSRMVADKLTATPTSTKISQPKTNREQQTSSIYSHAASFTYGSTAGKSFAETSPYSSMST
jgi:serine/threonine protein kinase